MCLFVADPRQSLIPAGGDVAALAGFQIIITLCIQIVPPPEQGEKEVDLFPRGTSRMNRGPMVPVGVHDCAKVPQSRQIDCHYYLHTG